MTNEPLAWSIFDLRIYYWSHAMPSISHIKSIISSSNLDPSLRTALYDLAREVSDREDEIRSLKNDVRRLENKVNHLEGDIRRLM
jgi:chromosome segregation ATPase